ncbi:MAG: relaxase/mobilization nuclease domain-containing protein [Eubacteriales bacterium]|nr:relaxase/mobilization nuclease domain-containing protein [Eubacteriales bacterium]
MAYIKIFSIKSTVKKAVDYITNPEKTEDQNLVSSYGCAPETADLEFAQTAKMGQDNVMEKGDNLAWHMIISFKPGEITDPKIAHEAATKIADAVLKGRHEYVLSTHVDKDHVHCHLIFNATNFVDYHKYVSNKRTYHKICKISNRICREYGLSESEPTGQKAKSYKEDMEYKRGTSWKAKLKYHVDRAIWSSVSYEEFLLKMKEAGYEIRQGKYLAFRAQEQQHFTNVKTLGTYYAKDSILKRLEKNRHKARIPQNATYKVRMFVQMTSYITDGDRPGYDQWAKRNNLKEAAKTFTYLSQHNLLNYEEFQNHISDLEASIAAADAKIQEIESRMGQQQVIRKHCEVYRACRDVVRAEKDAPDQMRYRMQHQAEYKLHDATLKELSALGIHKLPSPEKLQRQQMELEDALASSKREKQDLQKQQKTLQVIEHNFDTMIRDSGIKLLEKEPSQKAQENLLS